MIAKYQTKTGYLTTTALFAALICLTTAYLFHIPFGANGGYIHIGDALIYLAATLLPTPYALLAGAIGGAMADLLSAPIWAIPTFFIKMLIALPFTAKGNKIICFRNIAAIFPAGIISCIGYAVAEMLIYGSEAMIYVSLASSLTQAIGSGIVFILIGITLDNMRFKR